MGGVCSPRLPWAVSGENSLQFKDAGRFIQMMEVGCDMTLAGWESLWERLWVPEILIRQKFGKYTGSGGFAPEGILLPPCVLATKGGPESTPRYPFAGVLPQETQSFLRLRCLALKGILLCPHKSHRSFFPHSPNTMRILLPRRIESQKGCQVSHPGHPAGTSSLLKKDNFQCVIGFH